MPAIRPISELRKTNEISEFCHQTQEPLFITKNGFGDLVVMSMERYERQMARDEFREKMREAEEDIEAGVPFLDAEEVFARLKERYA